MSARDYKASGRDTLQPSLAPAADPSHMRDRLDQVDGASIAALESMVFGAVICDVAGRVIFANRAAQALARRGCGIRLGGPRRAIAMTLPQDAARLAQLLKDASGRGRAGAMGVTGGNGERMFVLVTPLPLQRVLITMRAAEPAPRVSAKALAAIFNLTPTEARVGAALSTGASATEIAANFAVGEETVRTHLKRLLDKAGVANQREFLAMLALVPPVSGDADGAQCMAGDTRCTLVQLPVSNRVNEPAPAPCGCCAVLTFTGSNRR